MLVGQHGDGQRRGDGFRSAVVHGGTGRIEAASVVDIGCLAIGRGSGVAVAEGKTVVDDRAARVRIVCATGEIHSQGFDAGLIVGGEGIDDRRSIVGNAYGHWARRGTGAVIGIDHGADGGVGASCGIAVVDLNGSVIRWRGLLRAIAEIPPNLFNAGPRIVGPAGEPDLQGSDTLAGIGRQRSYRRGARQPGKEVLRQLEIIRVVDPSVHQPARIADCQDPAIAALGQGQNRPGLGGLIGVLITFPFVDHEIPGAVRVAPAAGISAGSRSGRGSHPDARSPEERKLLHPFPQKSRPKISDDR